MRIAVCIPSGGQWEADFGVCLSQMMVHFSATHKGKAEIGIHNVRSSILPSARNELVEWALETEATHLLFLDDDMMFPRDALDRLLSHDKPIVAANCTTRCFPAKPTAYLQGGRLYTEEKAEGLREVDTIGTAVMLIKREVLERIGQTWFAFAVHPQKPNRCIGEDVWFCRQARKQGFKIFIDDGLSNEIGHIGQMVFTHRMARSSRDRGET